MALAGLVLKKERWGLSWRGWLLLFFVASAAAILISIEIFPFLAVSQRLDSDVLVVEGWVPLFAIEAAAKEFAEGKYDRVFTTGGPVIGMGGYTNDYNTSASVGAGRLRAAGVPAAKVQMVPSRVMTRDRTYAAAVALRDWFRANNLHPAAINVVTEGLHARRTQLLFQKAFGRELRVGVIGVPSPDYDPKQWWKYSEAVREVIGEGIAYTYAVLFFHPGKSSDANPPSKESAWKDAHPNFIVKSPLYRNYSCG